MALLAEEVVDEWLNRQGFFTIRGIKLGVAEMDILAIRHTGAGGMECRHYEVQASVNPVGYITQASRADQRQGVAANSAKKRDSAQLGAAVEEWIVKKFSDPRKAALRERLHTGKWSWHFVIGVVRHMEELAAFSEHSVEIIRLDAIVQQLLGTSPNPDFMIASASGKDLTDLIALGGRLSSNP